MNNKAKPHICSRLDRQFPNSLKKPGTKHNNKKNVFQTYNCNRKEDRINENIHVTNQPPIVIQNAPACLIIKKKLNLLLT